MLVKKMETLLLLLVLVSALCQAIPREKLYPFGVVQGDDLLNVGDDTNSDVIQLNTNIAFYDSYFNSLFINTNGLLTFETELPIFKSDMIMPNGRVKLIAAFLADVDTRLSGNIYYRETQDGSMLHKAAKAVHHNFPDHRRFRPRSLFIVTWDEVGYFDQKYDKTNTFQVVIASDGQDSFVMLLYPEDGINWVKSDGKYGQQAPDVPAQVGFDGGNNGKSTPLPGSGNDQVADLVRLSNIGKPGMWLFRVGNTQDNDIEIPGSNRVAVNDLAPAATSCDHGGRASCDANAECVDYPSGFCCQCTPSYFGNGLNCLQPNLPQRINGKVHGTVNGVSISEEDLHAYIVTKDGRVYTAISKVPSTIGISMQSLYTIGGVLGWLFAQHTTPKAVNGYSITGGDLNRTATVRFTAGGEKIVIRQEVVSSDAQGYMRMTTHINGNVPNIAAGAQVSVTDSKEEYRRTGAGEIKSYATHTYTVDEVPFRFSVDQTINFKECSGKPLDGLGTQRLVISRPFVVYGEPEEIVRYATTNKMSPDVGGDPCKELDLDCDTNADCVPSGSAHRCKCREGFYGDGLRNRCQDENECAVNSHDCDFNAQCVNTVGSFECECNQGYTGDGKTCQRDRSCADLICHVNANCVYDSDNGEPKCECHAGYTGDGAHCEAVEDQQCNVINNCGADAHCEYNEQSFGYTCRCMPGFRGDGFVCEPEPCDVANNCDRNAECSYEEHSHSYVCVCNAGFSGDGYRCEQAGCDVVNNCDRNARCDYDYEQRRYLCMCNEGFEGDGTYCRENVVACNEINNCDLNAECLYDTTTGNYQCQCRPGYSGDGFSCRVTDCRRDRSMCDINASCQQQGFDHICVCDEAFEGDGFTCKATGSGVSSSFLLLAQGVTVMDLPFSPNSNNRGKPTIYIPGQTAIGVDVDCYSHFFYWTDVSGKTISKARLDGTDSEVILSGLGSPEGIAVDWVARNIYWTDSRLDRIEVANVDGTNRKTLFDASLVNPRAIAVDPGHGYVFWTDWNREAPKIERANMDGTDRRVLVDTELGLPNGLTLDYDKQRVCWADAGTHMIECVDYTGRGRRIVYDKAGSAFGLAFANNNFYWTDWDLKMLPSVATYGGVANDALSLPPGGNGRLYGIATVREECPAGNNACSLNNGGCRFLCLPAPNGGRSCACPDDIDEEECNRIALIKKK